MNPDLLHQNIISKIELTSDDFKIIAPYFIRKKLEKKDLLLVEAEFNDKMFFVEKGLLFSYKTLRDGELQVIQFAKENHWITDLYSFFSGLTALFSIKALEHCVLRMISKQHFETICRQVPSMETFFRLSFQQSYTHTLIRLSDAYSEDAEIRYASIVEKQPDLVQRIPQYLLASYLGILPSSLSRIRHRAANSQRMMNKSA